MSGIYSEVYFKLPEPIEEKPKFSNFDRLTPEVVAETKKIVKELPLPCFPVRYGCCVSG